MIEEIAILTVDPARSAEFEQAVAAAAPLFQAASGCRSLRLDREIEDPARYRLVVQWESLEHHTVHFRNSEGFRKWRELAGPYFTAPPAVVHTTSVRQHF